MTEQSSDALSKKLYETMRQKSSDELLQIWKENDRTEWSDEAYVAIKQVLDERGVSLPAQTAPAVVEDHDDPNADALVRLSTWANLLSWVGLLVTVGISGINIVSMLTATGLNIGVAEIFNILSALLILLVGCFLFVFFQLVAKGIFVMLDILDNTTEIASNMRKRG